MEWIIQNWELIALGILVADKIVAATPCKWDDMILTAIKGAFKQVVRRRGKGQPLTFHQQNIAKKIVSETVATRSPPIKCQLEIDGMLPVLYAQSHKQVAFKYFISTSFHQLRGKGQSPPNISFLAHASYSDSTFRLSKHFSEQIGGSIGIPLHPQSKPLQQI